MHKFCSFVLKPEKEVVNECISSNCHLIDSVYIMSLATAVRRVLCSSLHGLVDSNPQNRLLVKTTVGISNLNHFKRYSTIETYQEEIDNVSHMTRRLKTKTSPFISSLTTTRLCSSYLSTSSSFLFQYTD
jgi:hypothetical protein